MALFSNFENIKILVTLLKKANIRHIVINPGTTNIPFINAVQDDPFFICYSIVDERSAMYFAIGLYLQTGEIIVTSCTSAQATRNYVPGLTEAFYKKVPILAVTMEKHPRFLYQEYMQAPHQSSLPKDCVKKTIEVPFIRDENDYLHSTRLINEAILELTHRGTGPVQLCIPWLDFTLDEFTPSIRAVNRYSIDTGLPEVSLTGKKIMIVVGEHRPFCTKDQQAIERFCTCHNAMVYVNLLSNYHGRYTVAGNLALTAMAIDTFVSGYAPDILISIGGQTGDYPFYGKLSSAKVTGVEHWRVCEDGNVVDTYDKLTKIFECSISAFFQTYSSDASCEHSYYEKWKALVDSQKTDVDLPFSNLYVAQTMHRFVPKSSTMYFSILNSLRVWSLFPLDSSIICYSNVAAFGIDGGLSACIGQSVESEHLSLMIVGDLAFYYDMNSLGIRHIKNNLRILLVNNNGGTEFKLSPCDRKSRDRYICASGHFKNAEGWANTCGFEYRSARTKEEFNAQMDSFLSDSDKPILFEIFVSDANEYDAFQAILGENVLPANPLKRKVKQTIKKLLK